MNKGNKFWAVLKKRTYKVFKWTLRSVLFFILSVFIALQFSAVQTWIAGIASSKISKEIGHEITIEKVRINWFDYAIFDNIQVKDPDSHEMIKIKDAKIDFKFTSFFGNPVIIEEIIFDDPSVHLVKDKKGKLNMNQFLAVIRSYFVPKKKKKKKKLVGLVIENVELNNGVFKYNDYLAKYMNDSTRFDYNHFEIDSIYAHGDHLYILKDTFNVDLRNLSGRETATNLHVKGLNTNLHMNKSELELADLDVYIQNSHIRNLIRFEYNHIRQMSYFNDSVNVVAKLDSSMILSKDLAYVVPSLKPYTDTFYISGNITGKMKDFKLNDFHFTFGELSGIHGDFSVEGLPNVFDTEIRAKFTPSHIHPEDLQQYTGYEVFKMFKKFGEIDFSSRFDGFPLDFVTYGKFSTDIGSFKSDINFKLDEEGKKNRYKGYLFTNGFDLGTFLTRDYLGKISLEGKVRGSGFTVEEADLTLDANISKMEIANYPYENIKVNARISESFFNGTLDVRDKFLEGRVKGKIDLHPDKNIFRVNTVVDQIYMRELGLVPDSCFFKGELDLDYKWPGFSLSNIDVDQVRGDGKVINTYCYYGGKDLKLKNFNFHSYKNDSLRDLVINSRYLTTEIKGNFDFKDFFKDLGVFGQEILAIYKGDQEKLKTLYKQENTNNYNVAFTLKAINLNEVFDVFYPQLHISPFSKITGTFEKGVYNKLKFETKIGRFTYDNYSLVGNQIIFDLYKKPKEESVSGVVKLLSKNQLNNKNPLSKNLLVDLQIDEGQVKFNTAVSQASLNNKAHLFGKFELKEHSSEVHIDSATVVLLGKKWIVDSSNIITFSDKFREVDVQNFSLHQGDQHILVNGNISNNDSKQLVMDITQLKMADLKPLVKTNLGGDFNGKVVLSSLYKSPLVQANVLIKDFLAEGYNVGNVEGEVTYRTDSSWLFVNTKIIDSIYEVFTLNGFYHTDNREAPIDFKAVFSETKLAMLEAYMAGQITEMQGLGTGVVAVTGSLKEPKLKGAVFLDDGAFRVSYLNTKYYFSDSVYFYNDSINFKNTVVYDSIRHFKLAKTKHVGVIKGGITHTLFTDFKVDVNLKLKNVLALNTKKGSNDLFYGTAYGSGAMRMYGTFEDLNIVSEALSSDPGTYVTIVSSGSGSVGKQPWITFESETKDETIKKDTVEQTQDNSGVKIKLVFDVDKDASATVIYGEEVFNVNDGLGHITFEMDTRDDALSLVGSYEVKKGDYRFKFANLIDKKFEALPGGIISWTGDPYQGNVDLTATYEQKTSLAPIIDTAVLDPGSNEASRPYPVYVLMHLNGSLLQPDITFDIDIKDYPRNVQGKNGDFVSLDSYVAQFKQKLRDDEAELNRQVFSLMVLQQLSRENSFQGGGGVGGNVSELIANQFSSWLSQVDENVEVDIDLNSLDQDALNNLRVRLSVQALDGRVRITRDGGLTNVDNSANLGSLFGEVTIEYMITEDGKLRLKAYNKTNQYNMSTSLKNTNNQLYGASILYTQSFNNLKELIKKKENNQDKKQQKMREDLDEIYRKENDTITEPSNGE